MACLTNTSIFMNGLGIGDICSGRGQCINDLCVCDEYWTGRSDFLNLDGLACQNPIILDRTLFALAAFSWLRLTLQGIPILLHQWQKLRERMGSNATKRSASSWQRIAPFDTILLMSCLSTPMVVASMVLRQFGNFGVDPVASFVFAFGIGSNWCLATNGQHMILASMLRGGMRGTSGVEVNQAIQRNEYGLWLATLLYVIALMVCFCVTVYTPPGITSFRVAMVVVRNMSAALYYIFQYFHSRKIIGMLSVLLSSMAEAKSKKERAGGGAHEVLVKTIDHLTLTLRNQLLVVTIFVPILVVFTAVPQLFVFNHVPHSLIMALGAGKNHVSFLPI